jgi:SOS-response transcriptional repressor LexA
LKTVGNIIKEKRIKLGLTMDALATKAGISHPYISNMENNKLKSPPALESIEHIADALELSREEKTDLLMLAALERTPNLVKEALQRQTELINTMKTVQRIADSDWGEPLKHVSSKLSVPVYTSISAGSGCPIYGDVIDWFPVPDDIRNGHDFVAYAVRGDSMEPEISSGDYVLVKLEVEPENGQLGVFNINDEYFVKRIKKYGDVKVLVSTNPNYKEIMATAGDVTSCLGKVVLVSKRY